MYNADKRKDGDVVMLFRKKVDRFCSYCEYAGKIDEDTMVCEHCGVVPSNHHCRRFRYDPLKRIPGRPKTVLVDKHNEKDFSL